MNLEGKKTQYKNIFKRQPRKRKHMTDTGYSQ